MTPIPMELPHRGYVVGTWSNGQRYGMRVSTAKRLVNRVLDSDARVIVFANGRTVHAWACGEGANILHYAYVPPELRKNGFLRKLVTSLFGEYPDCIRTTHPWPWPSGRYQYTDQNHSLFLRTAA